ncbi:MAG TPA: hypothetical protein VIY72_15150, partial [Acidimicrobiales bacterium]
EAGQNISQTSLVPLYYPEWCAPEIRDPIAAACEAGRSSCYGTGVYPGVMSDVIPMGLLAGCERVDRIRVTEILNYIEYYGVEEARLFGVGGPLDQGQATAEKVAEGSLPILGPSIRHLAAHLGVEIDEIRITEVEVAPALERTEVQGFVIEPGTMGALRHTTQGWAFGRPVIEHSFVTRYDNAAGPDWPAPRGGATGCYRIEVEGSLSLEVDGFVIEPGTMGALRHTTQGWAYGRPVIEHSFVTRYDNAAGPDWPAPRGGATGCYRIEVEGSLSLEVDINLVGHRPSAEQTMGFATDSAQLGAYLMTTAPAINAIPYLCQAEPGLYGSLDLDRRRDLHVIRST